MKPIISILYSLDNKDSLQELKQLCKIYDPFYREVIVSENTNIFEVLFIYGKIISLWSQKTDKKKFLKEQFKSIKCLIDQELKLYQQKLEQQQKIADTEKNTLQIKIIKDAMKLYKVLKRTKKKFKIQEKLKKKKENIFEMSISQGQSIDIIKDYLQKKYEDSLVIDYV